MGKAFLINLVARMVVGADWEWVKQKVLLLETFNEDGAIKKAKLKGWAKEIGLEFAQYILNFAIEAAVVWARTR